VFIDFSPPWNLSFWGDCWSWMNTTKGNLDFLRMLILAYSFSPTLDRIWKGMWLYIKPYSIVMIYYMRVGYTTRACATPRGSETVESELTQPSRPLNGHHRSDNETRVARCCKNCMTQAWIGYDSAESRELGETRPIWSSHTWLMPSSGIKGKKERFRAYFFDRLPADVAIHP